jgi:deazaflavin-dependent oxidoreductase (nitroreductase family)
VTQGTQPAPPAGLLRGLLRSPALLYHARLGFLLGHRFLLLVTIGRRTGQRRETMLEVMRYDRRTREVTVMAGWGSRTAWLHNVEAGLAQEVRIGRERYVPAYRVLEVDEAEAILAEYERSNRLAGPLVRRVLGGLLGWPYDGSPGARRRAVEQLRMVAFRP